MEASATVIIPTYGNAGFARWAIQSVQNQTVKDIEICVICDGSPERMISLFKNMAAGDPRLRVFAYPKSPRTGEPYRHSVIQKTTGKIICYCCHDDLWLPNHIEEIEKTLEGACFTHSWYASVNVPENIKNDLTIFRFINFMGLKCQKVLKKWLGLGYFGLTFGAHTRESYNRLKEGWVTTPRKDIATDLYMWLKFMAAYGDRCRTTPKLTALNFQKTLRKDWTEQEHDDELKRYFEKIRDPAFLKKIQDRAFLSKVIFYQIIKYFLKKTKMILFKGY